MSDLRSTVQNRRGVRRAGNLSEDRRATGIAAMVAAVDALEPRQLFSAALSTVTFRGETGQAVAGDYVISVGSKVNFAAVAAKAGLTNVEDLGGAGYYSFHTEQSADWVSKWAKGRSGVVAIGPDFVLTPQVVPNDPYYSYQYLANNTGQLIPNPAITDTIGERQTGTAGADMDLQAAWNITTGSASQIVADIDTGLDVTHQDIAPNVWVNTGEIPGNGLDDDGDGYVDDVNGANTLDGTGNITDLNGHGTATAGVIAAAGNNGIGVAGVSWSTKIMAVKSANDDGSVDFSNVVKGINYIIAQKAKGQNVVAANASLGAHAGTQVFQDPEFAPALRALDSAGIIFVTSAGNDGANLDNFVTDPQRTAFANGDTLVVAATDNRDQIASFSSYGSQTVAVAAPGVEVFTTTSKAAVTDALGNRLDNLEGYPVIYDSAGNPYVSIDGTSFSSPAVAGVVALAKAAYPNATPHQIVAAIKAGVDKLPSLSPSSSPTSLVSTGGRVNAYNTLRILGNQFVSQIATQGGSFQGKYGGRTAFVYGSNTYGTVEGLTSASVPAPATVEQGKLKKNDVSALPIDSSGALSTSFITSDQPISYTFDYGTSQRRVTFYVADFDTKGGKGSETFTVTDTASGATLASSDVTDYRGGRYVTFDLSGAVTVTITPKSGNAVLNGIFVDNSPSGTPFVDSSTTTGNGDFLGNLGDQGFVIPGGSSNPPAFATVSTTGTTSVVKGSNNPLLLETLTSDKVRSGGSYTGDSFDLNVTFTDTDPHKVTFYTAQTSKTARSQRISVVDSAGNVLASQDVTVAKSGSYTTFTVSHNTSSATSNTVTFRVTSLGGGPASVAGVFFSGSADPDVNYVGTDTTTGGQYRGKYGTQRYGIIGVDGYVPDFTGPGSVRLVDSDTKKKNALQNPDLTTGNFVAYLETQSSIDISLPVTALSDDSSSRRLSLYFVDYDKKSRVERVDVLNSAGKVVSSQILRDFQNGKYLTYDVTGDVTVRITRLSGPTAVVSGIFVD